MIITDTMDAVGKEDTADAKTTESVNPWHHYGFDYQSGRNINQRILHFSQQSLLFLRNIKIRMKTNGHQIAIALRLNRTAGRNCDE